MLSAFSSFEPANECTRLTASVQDGWPVIRPFGALDDQRFQLTLSARREQRAGRLAVALRLRGEVGPHHLADLLLVARPG